LYVPTLSQSFGVLPANTHGQSPLAHVLLRRKLRFQVETIPRAPFFVTTFLRAQFPSAISTGRERESWQLSVLLEAESSSAQFIVVPAPTVFYPRQRKCHKSAHAHESHIIIIIIDS
jgi:hypothetical protein